MNLVKYICPVCGISEVEYDCFARLFRSGDPPICEGTFYTHSIDIPPHSSKRKIHSQEQMVIVPEG